ncbi:MULTISPECIES: 5-formyltetrahydrofolate cyclo-ligase [Nosocomiicoccus]|uniref:5-formyltetrahydrofolate cyclo-ligase n=1 Tax=Nosocomiicoccus massiliensis TaxID=1232430 RepID=A0AAF1BNR7_9STAP|nr:MULTISPECIES: 5-formyltetrahydrofolate cyclo-ligase [Nosocomiicoccus]MDK6862623.1 5-formyltetrahydrofolate cyclo-ligase [Nosocomiicoccus ampullae]OFO55507.1 hypothetical protein HMPREF3029_04435 [Nosocomiicoccus sp. HMSC059G07]OFS64180.1 hypothetical protein HMPREF3177_01225 [Nosocomiicoccus sp. HMSC09A07]WOS96470.1 5-formyltetrahydrofolate cyclo-ligase [Nosocomiicoccus massiliensis]
MSKKELRHEMIVKLKSLNPTDKRQKEQNIYQSLKKFIHEHSINSVGIVLSMPHEIDTLPIIEYLNDNNIAVYGPKSNYKTKEMDFYRVNSADEIFKDEKGIFIPTSNELNNDVDLLVVPGVIFNDKGYRTGYGGGFYDRFLKGYQGKTVSILFDEQFGEVIVESHDMPVDYLITPTKNINARENRL